MSWYKLQKPSFKIEPSSTLQGDIGKTIKALDGICASITQTTPKVQSRMTSAIAAKLGTLGVAGGLSGLLTFGTASTGTAIGALSGAAATTAKLFWVGSLVGGGVAVGAGLIGATSLVGGYFAAKKGKEYLQGNVRLEDCLVNEEKHILNVARKVSIALQTDTSVSVVEFNEACVTFLVPLVSDINQFYFKKITPKGLMEVSRKTIKPIPLSKLFINQNSLRRVIKRNTT